MPKTARRVLSLLWAAAALFLVARFLRSRLLPVEVAGTSMTPALHPGDYLLVRRGRPRGNAFGQVAYLRDPAARPLLKRIVGVPGDSLRVGEGVEVNGRRLVEPYAHGEAPAGQYRGVHRLRPDEYFVLGDHRAQSTDSRDFGPVRGDAIEGVAWLRYWPPRRVGRVHRGARQFSSVQTDGPPGQPGPGAGLGG